MRRTDNAVVGWLTAAGFAIGVMLSFSTPERQAVGHGDYTSYYRPEPVRASKREPACPKGQDIATVTFAHGMIVSVTCAPGKPVER